MKPLVTAVVEGKTQVVGWTYERPDSKGGRSFGTTLGHFYETYRKEQFRETYRERHPLGGACEGAERRCAMRRVGKRFPVAGR